MPQFNEYSNLVQVAVRNPEHAFVSQKKISAGMGTLAISRYARS